MKADTVDVIYITQPMAKSERLELLKKFKQAAYLAGIDKGTDLESCKISRFQQLRKSRIRRNFMELVDHINENMQPGIKRFKRRKYRGRYKKKGKTKTAVPSQAVISYSNNPSWLKTQTNGKSM